MTKIQNKTQFDNENYIFKCYCGEHRFLEVSQDEDSTYIYITIGGSTLLERIKGAINILRGNKHIAEEIIIGNEDTDKLIKALKT